MENFELDKKILDSVLNTSVASAIDEPTLLKILVTNLVPKFLIHRYHKLRLEKQNAAAMEELFTNYSKHIQKEIFLCIEKLASINDVSESVRIEEKIKILEKKLNYLKVVKLVLNKYLSSKKPSEDVLKFLTLSDTKKELVSSEAGQENYSNDSKKEELFNQGTPESWLDIFQQICERRCEPWRCAILAEAYIQEKNEPNSVSLKTLWEIGLINTFTFESFIGFLNSSVYIEDDYPIVFYDHKDNESFMHKYVEIDDLREAKLFTIINHLEEHGLIMHGSVLFSSDEIINGFSKSHNFQIEHNPKIHDATGNELKFTGYHCTDLGLSIYNVCREMINLNKLSDESYEELKGLLDNYKDTISIIKID